MGNAVSFPAPNASTVGTGVSARPVGTVRRAVGLLDALAAADEPVGTNELARRTGVNASTVSRLLGTLAETGLVRVDVHTGRYRLGLRLFELGTAAVGKLDLRQVAREHLGALATAVGETATLSLPGDPEAMTVDYAQADVSVQSVARLGRPSVAHATAVGKVVLAAGGRLPAGRLGRCTSSTIVDRSALSAEIAGVADRGWAWSRGEREADLNAIAAPVAGPGGRLAGVLGLQGPAGRFDDGAMTRAVPILIGRAAAIARAIGG
ncbi:MAG: IclR family transcriptional regulator [Mycobacteriales bacterium]